MRDVLCFPRAEFRNIKRIYFGVVVLKVRDCRVPEYEPASHTQSQRSFGFKMIISPSLFPVLAYLTLFPQHPCLLAAHWLAAVIVTKSVGVGGRLLNI